VERPEIPRDDLLDVLEMTQRLEKEIGQILDDNEITIAMSALMSATVNCSIAQCDTLKEVIFFRNMFVEVFDLGIKSIKMKKSRPLD